MWSLVVPGSIFPNTAVAHSLLQLRKPGIVLLPLVVGLAQQGVDLFRRPNYSPVLLAHAQAGLPSHRRGASRLANLETYPLQTTFRNVLRALSRLEVSTLASEDGLGAGFEASTQAILSWPGY